MDSIIKTRINILKSFQKKSHTQGELVRELDLDPDEAHSQIKKLIDLGFLEEKIEEGTNRYYLIPDAEEKIAAMIKSFES
ncbi:MAG: winged helix-turn-helix domain-containing protein [Candidatus Dojkabacteria bacterium]|nr:winged helix-turn-helix domain-containing protein [Candidatus Dojkabacteria bacterium]